MKVEQLTDAALDQAVAQCEGQPAADCGLEVVGYWNGSYSSPYFREINNAPGIGVKGVPLIRKSDADARDAMRLAEIAELKEELDDANSGCQKWYLEAVKRGKELAALKARERSDV